MHRFVRRRVLQMFWLVVVPIYIMIGWNPDTRFESSDGRWHDDTDHLKDRTFYAVQFDFQEYRSRCKKPDVTLVRNTAMQPWLIVSLPWYIASPQWRVPYKPRITCVGPEHQLNCPRVAGWSDCGGGS
jgi:hypothetical protein